ncbi:Putative membrane protein [Gloeomargarita lithophora Alchichica-D10]|uniref:Membrane protein n=1 Tax=Gloeomargarita lithophora Alchichica-D10 TaxID=1188229 RepID=A0A1J0AFW3_9CYAN|nr:carotenoid biosynthesis protein [Gloeomargarita lithophora]APB34830.1 Putative membrane protein [Gloeomargarita lithophora Alchichica-D10]
MTHGMRIERLLLTAHILAMVFGVAGLVLVLPHPTWVLALPVAGQRLFAWSMAGGGIVYILLGALAVGLYGLRVLGARLLWGFLVPAVGLSLGSELLGTSTGFPFGHYGYLDGLGYKIAGLVPFTIPLSWFYMGLVCFLLAYGGLGGLRRDWVRLAGAVALGSVLLMAWDLALDPAMSQTPVPFWEFQEVGAFFGMPYRNLAGWVGTGAVFMAVAAGVWGSVTLNLSRRDLTLPLVVYLVNFLFGAVITLGLLEGRYWIPIGLGVLLGVIPAILCWWRAGQAVSANVILPELDLITR